MSIVHETLVFERRYPASPSRVFQAYADEAIRARWSAPTPTTAIVYESTDFRVGGHDIYRCGAIDDLRYLARAYYCDVERDRRIVFAEAVTTEGETLSVSLNTWDIIPDGSGTRLVVTVQLAAYGGKDMLEGTRFGTNAALDNLGSLVAS